MKKRDRGPEDLSSQWINGMCDLLKGGIFGGFVTILSLLVCAGLVSAGIIREHWIDGTILISCVLGALVGGAWAVRAIGRRPLLAGIGVGGVLFLLLLTAGFLVYDTATLEQGGTGILFACLCGGGIAGILLAPRKKRRR
jgi:putative membrane protein (TIGR04086 family)